VKEGVGAMIVYICIYIYIYTYIYKYNTHIHINIYLLVVPDVNNFNSPVILLLYSSSQVKNEASVDAANFDGRLRLRA
jgi:hypothetical protein